MKKLLENKLDAKTHGFYERDIQALGSLTRSGLANDQKIKSNIKFLIHSMKGKVDSINDMMEVATTDVANFILQRF